MPPNNLIDPSSGPGAHNCLKIFGVPPTNVSIAYSELRELLPLNASSNEYDNRFEFRHFSDDTWLDPSNIYLYLQLGLEKKDKNVWVPIVDTDTDVGAVQCIGQSFVQTLKLHINGTEVFSESLYPYMCYFKNMLSFSEDVRYNKFVAGGWAIDNEYMNNSGNPGFKARVGMFEKGRIAEFQSKLEFDLANQELFLLNNLDIVFTIYKADDDFLVHTLKASDTNVYRFKVHNIRLLVKTVNVQPEANNVVVELLENIMAKYPLRKIEMRSVYLSIGRTELIHNLFTNIVPRRVILGIVNNKAYKGDPKLYPFEIIPASIKSISILANGREYPAARYELNFDDEKNLKCVRPFLEMHDAMNLTKKNTTNGINLKKFKKNCAFFVITLTSTLDDTGAFEMVRNGTTTIKITFNTAVPEPGYTLLALGEFDQLMYIDANRVITTDSSI